MIDETRGTSQMDVARPLKSSVRVEQDGAGLFLWRRPGSLYAERFLAMWFTGWTMGCVFITWGVIQHGTLQSVLFAMPFWASWIFVSSISRIARSIAKMVCRVESKRACSQGNNDGSYNAHFMEMIHETIATSKYLPVPTERSSRNEPEVQNQWP